MKRVWAIVKNLLKLSKLACVRDTEFIRRQAFFILLEEEELFYFWKESKNSEPVIDCLHESQFFALNLMMWLQAETYDKTASKWGLI